MLLDLMCDENLASVVDGVDVPEFAFFDNWVRAALARASASDVADKKPARHEMSLSLVGENDMQALNREWRGKDSVTNVLSFPADLPPLTGNEGVRTIVLGDLVICPAVVASEAQMQKKGLVEHWAHIIVHGTLHLCGHDHENDREAEAMEALEIQILSEQNIPNPYGARAHPS